MHNKIVIRKATTEDIPNIVKMEKQAWPEGLHGTEEMFRSRIETFHEGVLVAEIQNTIVGDVVAEIIYYDLENPPKTWYEATDNGFIKKTHQLNGNVLFGVDLTVSPNRRESGIGSKLLMEVAKLTIRKNLKFGVLGGRLPSYYKYYKDMNVDEYVNKRTETGEYLDPELRFYHNANLKIGKPLPNYFNDPQSMNYGIQLIWENPFYVRSNRIGKIIGKITQLIFRI